MSHKHRGRSSGGGAAMPVAHTPSHTQVELDQHHTIDIGTGNGNGNGKGRKTKANKKKPIHTHQPTSDDDAPTDDDDPYDSPAPSTAGDQFYDSFAALELKIATGSTQLTQVIKILKQIRLHPDLAERLADELDDKLSESGALLSEIELIQKKFLTLNMNANVNGKFTAEEKTKRASLRDRVSQDIIQLRNSYRTLRQASQVHLSSAPNGSYDPDDDVDSSHHSLLSDSGSGSASSHPSLSGHYQSEYIGELDGHLAMLAEQAAERNRFMKTIESDVVQVHHLFRDLNSMVNAQQAMVDDIDAKISDTQENARQGMEQLLQAQQYQAAKRKKMCFLVLMLIIALFLFFLFLWVAFGG